MTPRPPHEWVTPEVEARLARAPRMVARVLLLADALVGDGSLALLQWLLWRRRP